MKKITKAELIDRVYRTEGSVKPEFKIKKLLSRELNTTPVHSEGFDKFFKALRLNEYFVVNLREVSHFNRYENVRRICH